MAEEAERPQAGDGQADWQAHWDAVYRNKSESEVSWYEESPGLSVSLLRSAGVGLDAAVVDVGGGASSLVDALLEGGQAHVTVLDLSAAALERSRRRLPHAVGADWIVSDLRDWKPSRRYDAWHDRAVLHFLTEAEDRQAYVAVLGAALAAGGIAVIGTFAPDGPEKCSGLPVMRHDAQSLQLLLGADFVLLGSIRHQHRTPWGSVQNFQFSTFRRLGPPAPASAAGI
jgi:SAM-dependent methyltransferase